MRKLRLRIEVKFTGNQTGFHISERIAAAFVSMLETYDLHHKLDHIITDKAANIKKAFTVCFPALPSSDDTPVTAKLQKIDEIETVDDVDDTESWEELTENEQAIINNVIDAAAKKEILLRFYHSLHLTIFDGLNDTKCMSAVIAKTSKLFSILHQSQIFRMNLS